MHLASQWGSRKNTHEALNNVRGSPGCDALFPPYTHFFFSFFPTLSVRIVQSVDRRGGRVWPELPTPSQEG